MGTITTTTKSLKDGRELTLRNGQDSDVDAEGILNVSRNILLEDIYSMAQPDELPTRVEPARVARGEPHSYRVTKLKVNFESLDYKVNKVNDDICYLRLDFEQFQTNHNINGDGACNDFLEITTFGLSNLDH